MTTAIRTVFALCALVCVWTFGQGTTGAGTAEVNRLFRQKCFRCHDASLTLRPVPPERIDSLVQAMRRYDTLWIKPHEARAITEFMKRSQIHKPLTPSQQKE